MRTILALCLAATALVAQTSPVIEPHLAGVLEPLAAAQFLLPVHGFSSKQLAYAPVPHPALRAGATTHYLPDPLLCSAKYVGGEVAQLVFVLPQGAIVLLDASSSLAMHVLSVPPLTWSTLAGVCIDGEKEQVVLLDAAGPSFLRIDLADLRAGEARFKSTWLPFDWSTVRGIAFDFARDRIVGFDPETGDLLQHSVSDPNTSAGMLRPVPEVLAFGFAPTESLLQGPGDHDLFVSSGDQRMLTSEWTWNAAEPNVEAATLRATVATSSWSPPSPDPSSIAYDNFRDRLVVSDGEVDEMSIYAGFNVWESSRTGIVSRRTTTVSYSHEPVGITFQSATRTFYLSDDDQRRVHVIAAGPDGLLHTSDDTRRSFRVDNFCTDPEDLAFNSAANELWIAGGETNRVHRLRPGSNGIFDGTSPEGDDQVLTVTVSSFGVSDPEGIGVRASDAGVYVVGKPKTLLLHLNNSGQFVRTVNLPSSGLLKPAGLVFAPRSSGTGDSLYLVDRGVDNDSSSSENDGRMFEYGVPGPAPINQAPVVNAGPDVTTLLTSAAHLVGTVTDDGLPGPLLIQWSKLSGPGTASFTAPTQAITDVSFSAAGSHTCQLSAFDGEFTRTDTVVVTVQQPPAGGSTVERTIATSDDDAEQAGDEVARSSSDLEMVLDGSVNQVVGLRFQNLTIPAGSVITSAYVQFTADETTSTPTQLTIAGQASDNATTFVSTANNISSRPRTTATVAWAPVAWTVVNEAGLNQRTPNLASIVQQITNRPGWVSGNSIVFVITGTGVRIASAYDDSPAVAARLIVNHAPANQPPVVNAGPDVTIPLTSAAHLAGTVTDDGLPGPLTIQWSKLSGPGTASFAAPSQASTTATFSASGSYTCQLSAFDGEFTRTDTVVVTALPVNQPPVVDAGPDVTIQLPAAAHLLGAVTDDGLSGPLTIQWSQLSGPGTASFTAPTQAITDVSFSAAGSYTCQLSASDGEFTRTDTVVVTVQPVNQPPVVDAGPDVTTPLTAAAHLSGTATDDGLPGPLLIQWSKLSGPGTATFTAPMSAITDVSFSAAGSYTCQLSAFDGEFTSTDTVVVTVQPVNQPPVVDAGPDVTILLTAAAHLVGNVTDDGLPGPLLIQWSKLSGPGTASFTAPTQAITDVSFSAAGSYTCQLIAYDGEFTRADTVVVTVQQPPSPSLVERAIATSDDDAEQAGDEVARSSSDLEMVLDGSVNQVVGLRFQNLTIPPGAVITAAYVQFTADETGSTATQLAIAGQASDNATAFVSTANNISSRPRTTATVAWSPAAWTVVSEAGLNQRTPNLASVVGEITSRPGWSAGNSIVFVITGTGLRIASAYDDSPAVAARLSINYQAAATNQPPVVHAGPDVAILSTSAAHLAGTVTDDGLPGPLTIQWSKLSGPGTASFTAPTQATTDVSFSAAGSYTCELRAFDGEFASTDTVVVTVQQSPGGGSTVERTIATSDDDAEQAGAEVARSSSDLEMVLDGSVNQVVGLRFQNLTIPPGAVITAAYVQFTADETGSTATQLTIAGQASDNATAFVSTANNISSRPRTTATVAWSPAAWTVVSEAGLNQRTPNLASVVGEITSRPGWSAGNSIVFVITGTGLRIASAYDDSPAVAARLLVNYQPPAPINQPPVVNAGPDVTTQLTSAAHLVGTATDDGLPGPLTIQWSKLSGPGTASFTAPTQPVTDVSFSALGSYTCQLSASDGQFTRTDTVVVTVVQTLVQSIATSADDAEEGSGSVNRTSGDLELVVDGSETQTVGLRFQNLTIPAGAVITSAYVQFTTDETGSTPTQLTIAGQASDNAPTFAATAANISSRPRTTATVAWAPVAWTIVNEAGPDQRTPDLASIVQQITSRPGWSPGNAMVFVITGTGTRTASAYDDSPAVAAQLIVTYQ